MIRIAIAGAGGIAREHMKCLSAMEGVEIKAVADVVRERAEQAAGAYGAEPFTSLSGCLDKVDAVYILTPPKYHASLALEALTAGKHIFVEKPVAETVAEAEAVAVAAERAGVLAMTAFNMRFRRGFRRLKEVLDSGALGTPVSYWSQRLGIGVPAGDNWRTNRQTMCGMTIESLSHDIDLIRWMLGDIRTVKMDVHFSNPDLPGFDDHASAVFSLTGGVSAVLHASWASQLARNSRGIVGTEGTALIEGDGQWRLSRFRMRTKSMRHDTIEVLDDDSHHESYMEENRAFIHSVRTGQPLPTTIRDGMATVRVSQAMLASGRTGETVTV